MSLHEVKQCPRCNITFECKPGNVAQCQCYGIQLTVEQKAFIEHRYIDCLCITCLTTLQKDIELFKEK